MASTVLYLRPPDLVTSFLAMHFSRSCLDDCIFSPNAVQFHTGHTSTQGIVIFIVSSFFLKGESLQILAVPHHCHPVAALHIVDHCYYLCCYCSCAKKMKRKTPFPEKRNLCCLPTWSREPAFPKQKSRLSSYFWRQGSSKPNHCKWKSKGPNILCTWQEKENWLLVSSSSGNKWCCCGLSLHFFFFTTVL